MAKVKFVNEKVTVDVADGDDLRSVARQNGVQLYEGPQKVLNCMGFDAAVVIANGPEHCSKRGFLELVLIMAHPLLSLNFISNDEKNLRLACCVRIYGDVEVETHPPINWHGDKFWG